MNVIADTKNGKQDDEAKKPLSAPRLKKITRARTCALEHFRLG